MGEENKVLRGQLELSQVKQEIDKRIHEKEEEFDATRKSHQRAIDSMQASLEAESKSKAEALRLKKKLEADIGELEIALDHANKANGDVQKQIKKAQNEVKDMQVRFEEEQRLASVNRAEPLSARATPSTVSWRSPALFLNSPTVVAARLSLNWPMPMRLSATTLPSTALCPWLRGSSRANT